LRTPGFDPNDDDAVQAIREKAETGMQAFQSKYNEVNNELIARYNQNYAQWDTRFNGELLQLKAKSAADEQDASETHFYENGNKLAFEKLQYSLEAAGAQGPEVTAKKIEDFDNTSGLYQARIDIGENRIQMAMFRLEELKGLSADQMDYRDRLLASAAKQNDDNLEAAHQEYWQLLQTGQLDTLEAKINDPFNPLPVTGDGGKNWWRNLIAKREAVLVQTDLKVQSKVADAIIFEPHTIDPKAIRNYAGKGIKGGLSLDKVAEYENKYNLALDKTSAINTPLAKTFFNELKNAETDRAFSIDKIKNDVIYGQSLDSLTDFFVDFRKKNARDPSLTETQEFYQNLISGYRTPERPFTDAKIQQTVGELESGGAVSIFGTVMPFSRSEDAINHLLRNLGPNWQKIAPEAAAIIKERWPEAKISGIVKITKPQELEIGQRIIHTDGIPYEYRPDGADDQQPWKPIE